MELATDGNSRPMQIPKTVTALASTRNTSLSSEVQIVLEAGTRLLRITAENQGVHAKWGTGVTTADDGYDAYIPAGATHDYGVQNSFVGGTASFIQNTAGAAVIVIQLP